MVLPPKNDVVDTLLVGAGIMSTTLATMLKELEPDMQIELIEMNAEAASESSNPWNNAGTGHAGLCELNYTPMVDGQIQTTKALQINAQFEMSRQFWAHLVKLGTIKAQQFINKVPHLSFVGGEKNVNYLKARFDALKKHHAFSAMQFSSDFAEIKEWLPLMMNARNSTQPLAVTKVEQGTDVNFGALTTELVNHLVEKDGVKVRYQQKVIGLQQTNYGWNVVINDLASGKTREVTAKFVFLGAGGAALSLLQMSKIPEGLGFGGFPISGQWLRCDNPQVVEKHHAKVYSLAAVDAPPMSVPHLDTRIVDRQHSLLFGPFAGFSTKFLKRGSIFDLPFSVRLDNIQPLLRSACANLDLTKYLIKEVMQSKDQRLQSLKAFYPDLNPDDWRLEFAGQRVQIIKKHPQKGGVLQFGTELVTAGDGTIAALLGASPGASVSVSIMLDLIKRCFAKKMDVWQKPLNKIFIANELELQTNAELYHKVQQRNLHTLQII